MSRSSLETAVHSRLKLRNSQDGCQPKTPPVVPVRYGVYTFCKIVIIACLGQCLDRQNKLYDLRRRFARMQV